MSIDDGEERGWPQCETCGCHVPDVDTLSVVRVAEILEAYAEDHDGWAEIGYNSYPDRGEGTLIPLLGRVKLVEQVGGEGQGDHAHLVFQVGSRLFRKDGYHASFDGTHYDGDLYVVTRQEKTVTVYE